MVHDGKILVNRCISKFGEYYALPGGGQHTGEMLSETVKRELLEETGYSVVPLRLSGIYERISEGRRDGNSHKIYFIFLCRLDGAERKAPTETDRFQIGCEWIELKDAHRKKPVPPGHPGQPLRADRPRTRPSSSGRRRTGEAHSAKKFFDGRVPSLTKAVFVNSKLIFFIYLFSDIDLCESALYNTVNGGSGCVTAPRDIQTKEKTR